jgi:hypothetical protein
LDESRAAASGEVAPAEHKQSSSSQRSSPQHGYSSVPMTALLVNPEAFATSSSLLFSDLINNVWNNEVICSLAEYCLNNEKYQLFTQYNQSNDNLYCILLAETVCYIHSSTLCSLKPSSVSSIEDKIYRGYLLNGLKSQDLKQEQYDYELITAKQNNHKHQAKLCLYKQLGEKTRLPIQIATLEFNGSNNLQELRDNHSSYYAAVHQWFSRLHTTLNDHYELIKNAESNIKFLANLETISIIQPKQVEIDLQTKLIALLNERKARIRGLRAEINQEKQTLNKLQSKNKQNDQDSTSDSSSDEEAPADKGIIANDAELPQLERVVKVKQEPIPPNNDELSLSLHDSLSLSLPDDSFQPNKNENENNDANRNSAATNSNSELNPPRRTRSQQKNSSNNSNRVHNSSNNSHRTIDNVNADNNSNTNKSSLDFSSPALDTFAAAPSKATVRKRARLPIAPIQSAAANPAKLNISIINASTGNSSASLPALEVSGNNQKQPVAPAAVQPPSPALSNRITRSSSRGQIPVNNNNNNITNLATPGDKRRRLNESNNAASNLLDELA